MQTLRTVLDTIGATMERLISCSVTADSGGTRIGIFVTIPKMYRDLVVNKILVGCRKKLSRINI